MRRHEIWTTPDGRIVYRIRNFETGERISLTDRSASEYILTLEQLAREITEELESFILPPRLHVVLPSPNGQPRISPELPEDFERPAPIYDLTEEG